MRNAAESVNAYHSFLFRRQNSEPPRPLQAGQTAAAADLRLVDRFAGLSRADRQTMLGMVGEMLREEMRARTKNK